MEEQPKGVDPTGIQAALDAASSAVAGVVDRLFQLSDSDLSAVLAQVDAICAAAAGARAAVVAEGVARGVSVAPPWGATPAWVSAHAPSLRSGGAGQLVKAVQATDERQFAPVRAALISGRVDAGTAVAVCESYRALEPRLRPEASDDVIDGMIAVGESAGPRGVHGLRERLIATYGYDGELDSLHESARRQATLTAGRSLGDGLWDYRMVLTAEGRAVLEAAIGPLSRPAPVTDDLAGLIERDRRPAGQRRIEALVSALRQAVRASGGALGTKSAVFVTMALDDLQRCVRAGAVLGSTASGELLAPAEVRRLACDAAIIPAVLGSQGELVDLGRATRLFTPAQTRALWLRDGHCTYPGCDTPAHWCDAHHLRHWADGGPTTLENAALLCPRHHQHVHTHRLLGEYRDGAVAWDIRPGTYPRRQ